MRNLLDNVANLALEAGARIREEFYLAGGPRGGGDKADIDTEVEAFLRVELEKLLPGSAMLGEELGSRGSFSAEFCWLVDPHDGTAAFLRGFRGSSVSIGLLQNNKPVLGVVYAPLYPNDSGDLIAGGPGLGLFRNGEPQIPPLSSDPFGPDDIVALSQDADQRSPGNIKAVVPGRFLAMPSIAYRLALTAAGDARVGQSLVYLQEHDIAAGHALLLATGKTLLTWQDGPPDPVLYHPRIRSVRMIGGDPMVVDQLRSREPSAVLSTPKLPALSPCPTSRHWRSKGWSLERAQGCLMGQIAGDSLGSLVEFQDPAKIAKKYPEGPRQLADGGTWNTLAGQPTDDSEMALALARQLVEDGGYRRCKVLSAYKRWLQSGPFDVGTTTSRGLKGNPNWDSQANGSLMRCSPLGLAYAPEELALVAAADSALTHPNRLCTECCRVFTQTISHGIAGRSVSEALELALAGSGEIRELLLAALEGPPEDFMKQMGWVRVAFANAFYLLAQERPLEAALVWTVRQGGDTDTNAAIAGALLGAFQGLDAIPRQWRLSVLTCRPDRANSRCQQPRPRLFWPVDVLNLAELLLEVRHQPRTELS